MHSLSTQRQQRPFHFNRHDISPSAIPVLHQRRTIILVRIRIILILPGHGIQVQDVHGILKIRLPLHPGHVVVAAADADHLALAHPGARGVLEGDSVAAPLEPVEGWEAEDGDVAVVRVACESSVYESGPGLVTIVASEMWFGET